MEFYKPYAFLYKGVPTSNQITVGIVVWLPGNKRLSAPSISTDTATNTTTITYSLDPGTGADHLQEVNEAIPWNNRPATVEVVIGSGSGASGGGCKIGSGDFF